MKYLLFIGLIIVVSLVIYGCKSMAKNSSEDKANAPIEDDIVTPTIMMGLSKSSCKGTCEVYDMTIDKNRGVLYNGIKNTTITGKLTAKLSQTQFDDLPLLF